ncbi:MAG: hypothetical protein JWO15_1743 [Sphingomonadales bacterium]|nr:hypothetical protein [Sphingomonadales bacterium]
MEQHEQLIARAIAAYREVAATRVDGASPGGLVLMSLEELIDCLDAVAGAIAVGQSKRRDKMRARAETFLFSLQTSLNGDAGTLSLSLARIYREVARLMAAAVVENDPERCDRARDLVEPLVEAWREIVQTA